METQYNYQVRPRGDNADWENIVPIRRNHRDRVSAMIFGRSLARMFNAEVRMTEGKSLLQTSGTYIRDENE